mmetsp:Transcript_52350/g.167904  ORF Transcript_52350/g.167904 Transcript_52350/m.167904 type:complete len:322 (+) Transcript_52350:1888-2853(+)
MAERLSAPPGCPADLGHGHRARARAARDDPLREQLVDVDHVVPLAVRATMRVAVLAEDASCEAEVVALRKSGVHESQEATDYCHGEAILAEAGAVCCNVRGKRPDADHLWPVPRQKVHGKLAVHPEKPEAVAVDAEGADNVDVRVPAGRDDKLGKKRREQAAEKPVEVKVEGVPDLARFWLCDPCRRVWEETGNHVDLASTGAATHGDDEIEAVEYLQEHLVVLFKLVSLPKMTPQQLVLEFAALSQSTRGGDPALHHTRAVQDVRHRVCEPLRVQDHVLAQLLLVEEDDAAKAVQAPQARDELLLALDAHLTAHVLHFLK